jgi:hypothetical protein
MVRKLLFASLRGLIAILEVEPVSYSLAYRVRVVLEG